MPALEQRGLWCLSGCTAGRGHLALLKQGTHPGRISSWLSSHPVCCTQIALGLARCIREVTLALLLCSKPLETGALLQRWDPLCRKLLSPKPASSFLAEKVSLGFVLAGGFIETRETASQAWHAKQILPSDTVMTLPSL